MLRRLLSKVRNRLLPRPDPAMFDERIETRLRESEVRFEERVEAQVNRRLDERLGSGVEARLEAMMRLSTPQGHPNINPLWRAMKDLEFARLNIKLLGYQLGLAHEYRLQAIPIEAPGPFMADCKPVTQGDIETRWFRYWCEQLRERPRYHRKLWEFTYVMQGLHAAEALKPGAKVLILGADYQLAASYLAAKGADVVIAQHLDEPMPGPAGDPLHNGDLVDKKLFDKRVTRRPVDLGAPPEDLTGFDACVCTGAATRRGSISAGINLIHRAVGALKPGGVAVYVVDYNYANDQETLDDWGSVLFQRRHFEQIAATWKADGHEVTPLDFNVGYQALDRFIDIPPFDVSQTESTERLWRDGWQAAHLKTAVDGFAVTSFGMVVRRSRG